MPLIPVFRRQSQANLGEFKANLVYRASFRTAKATKKLYLEKTKKSKLSGKSVGVFSFDIHTLTSVLPRSSWTHLETGHLWSA